jgi:hypothetical protein
VDQVQVRRVRAALLAAREAADRAAARIQDQMPANPEQVDPRMQEAQRMWAAAVALAIPALPTSRRRHQETFA